MPDVDAAQNFVLVVHGPQDAYLPAQPLANRFQDLVRAFNEIYRARNDARDRVLQREPVLGAASIGDVASETTRVNEFPSSK